MLQRILLFIKKPAVKIIISLIIISALIVWLPIDELWETVQDISIFSWLLVLAGFLSGHILGAFKWKLLLGMSEKPLPFLIAVRCYFAGLFSNLFLPSLAGGDVIKIGLVIRNQHPKAIAVVGTLTDRVIDTISVVLIIIVAGLLSPKFLQPQDQKLIYIMVILFAVLFLGGFTLLLLPVHKFPVQKVKDIVNKIRGAFLIAIKNPVKPFIALLLSLCIQSEFILLTVYLADIININIPVVLWFLIWPLAKLSALLPISLGGIGVREVALATLLARVSVSVTDAVALGLLWESILITGGIAGGLLYLTLNIISGENELSLLKLSREKEFKE